MPNGETVPKDSAIFKEIKNIEYDEEIIIAGELYSLKNNTERERYSDIHSALSQKKDDKIHFAAFDIIQGSSENLDIYSKKINLISKILQDTNYLHPIKIEETDAAQVSNFFDNIVVKGHSEGLVIRDDRRIFKMKQDIDLDLVVLGYTLQQKDSVRSIALGIVLSEKEYLHVGSVGTLGSDKKRKELFKQLSQHKCTNPYRMPASNGSLYQFVIPKRDCKRHTK
jgi:ATP-dependent DNA ligase